MPYITLCALDVICSKYMYSVKCKTTTSSNLSASYKHSGLKGGVSEKRDSSFFSPSTPLLPNDDTRLPAKSSEIVFVFRFQYCVFIQCSTEWLVSQFFAVCVLSAFIVTTTYCALSFLYVYLIYCFLLVTSMDASPNAQEDVDSPYVNAVLR